MYISTKSIVSNSDMIKKFKFCRNKAENMGKVYILKNNEPDAVLFSIKEYEKISVFLEYIESHDENDIARITALMPAEGNRNTYSFDQLKHDIDNQQKESQ